MKEYSLKYSELADADVVMLSVFAMKMHTFDFAVRYVTRLRSEIESLSYLAEILPENKYQLPKQYHPKAKTLAIGGHKLTVIFHIEGEYVMVDKILPSSMITY